MYKVNIIKNGVVKNSANFNSQGEAESWLELHQSLNSFGINAHSYQSLVSEMIPAVFEEMEVLYGEGYSFDPPLFETTEVSPEVPAVFETINVDADYTYEILDITDEVNQELANKEALSFLEGSDWKILRHKDQQDLGIATSLTAQEYQDLLQERQMAREAII